MSITGNSSIRRLKDVAIVMDLHEFAPFGGRATGGSDGRRFELFAQLRDDLADEPWFGDERDQPDVATTVGALEWKRFPTRAISLAQAISDVSGERGF